MANPMLHLTTLTSRLLLSLFRRDWAIGLQFARSSLSLSRVTGRLPGSRSMNQSTASSDISSDDGSALRFNPVGECIFLPSWRRIWKGSPIVAVVRLARFRDSETFPAVSRKLAATTAAASSAQAEKFYNTPGELLGDRGEHSRWHLRRMYPACATARGGDKGCCDQVRHCLLLTASDSLTASSVDCDLTRIGAPQAVAH
jgi:hypothetical protein